MIIQFYRTGQEDTKKKQKNERLEFKTVVIIITIKIQEQKRRYTK